MIDYRGGDWGFHVAFGWNGSLAPRSLVMAIPNALLTLIIANMLKNSGENDFHTKENTQAAQMVIAAITPIMIFILYNRSRTSYNRWWEGGTLLQKTRGEWFNAYSSIMAFTSTKPELQDQVDRYVHLLARLMSLLMCCGLQQVSPNRDRPFEIIGLDGIEPESMEFLNEAPDKVEIILQWIQRSMVLHQQTGVLPVAPPILSRAFQEVSRGIVNLQNARKIADFPYPYPLAQISMILQLLHWATTPIASAMALPLEFAVLFSFFTIFVLWCIHFNALDLEFPFGSRVNDLPMQEFQQEWNNSIRTLVAKRATRPPKFDYDPVFHDSLSMVMSDASELYVPTQDSRNINRRKIAVIKVPENRRRSMEIDGGEDGVPRRSEPAAKSQRQTAIAPADTKAKSVEAPPEKTSATPSAVGKPEARKECPSAEPIQSSTQHDLETSVQKQCSEVSANDIGVPSASIAKATNDTAVAAASTAQSSRYLAPQSLKVSAAVLTQVSLPIEPLLIDTSAANSSAAYGLQSNVKDIQRSNDEKFDSTSALLNVVDSHGSNQESRCRTLRYL